MRIITFLIVTAVLATAAFLPVGGVKIKKKSKGGEKEKGKGKGNGKHVQYVFTPAPAPPVSHPYIVHVPQPFPVPHPFEVVKQVFVPFKVVEKVPYEVVRHVPYETIKYVPIEVDKGYSAPTYNVVGPPTYGTSSYHSSPSFSSHRYSTPTYSLSPNRRISDTAYRSDLSERRSLIRDANSHYRYSPMYGSSALHDISRHDGSPALHDTSQHYFSRLHGEYDNGASTFGGASSKPKGRNEYTGEFQYFE